MCCLGKVRSIAINDGFLPDIFLIYTFLFLSHAIRYSFAVDELTKLQEQRLKIHFNPDTEKMLDRQISEVSTRISSIFSICLEKLRVMNQAANTASSQTEAKIWKNIHRGWSNHLHEQSVAFRKIQRNFLEQMKQISQGQSFNATLGAGALNDVEADTGFSNSQMAELEFAEGDVNQRLQEITNIAESVNKLAPIIRELLTLVVDQGTMLDRIDGNMEEVSTRHFLPSFIQQSSFFILPNLPSQYSTILSFLQTLTLVNRGVTDIKKAEEYQKSAYPVKIIAFLMVVISIMIIVIIVRKSK